MSRQAHATLPTARAASPRIGGGSAPPIALAALAAVAALVRAPMLGAGWGSDMDAWRYAAAALHMRASGHYEPSRVPAFPGWEFVVAALAPAGPWAAVLWSLVCGAVACVLFVRVAERLRLPHPLALGFALALAPGAAVTATQAMDYAQALALFVGAWLALSNGRALLGGALLGVAAATRPTLALCVPAAAALLLVQGLGVASVVRMLAGAAAAWLALHAPTFGHPALVAERNPLAFHAARQHVTIATFAPVVRGALVDLLGRAALFAIAAGLAARVLPRVRRAPAPPAARPVFEVLALAPLIALYLLVPLDSGYLVVALPLVLALLARALRPGAMPWVAAALALELLVQPLPAERRMAPGRIAAERAQRLALVREAHDARRAAPESTVVLTDRSLLLRMLVHERDLARGPAAWAPFHATGVALRAPDRSAAWANDLTAAQHDSLLARGWRVLDRRTVRAGL